MSQSQIQDLLEKTKNYDKDERYMATSDLCNILTNSTESHIDESMEKRICAAVLKQLDDSSNDVQSIAVKCLSILVKKSQEPQVIEICDKLCNMILSGKDDLRDIYSIGLKTCIQDLPEEIGPAVASRLAPRLLSGVAMEDNATAKKECLDLLTDILSRFGESLESEYNQMSKELLKQLGSKQSSNRKRATTCIGQLAKVVPDNILNKIMETILNQIESPTDGQDQRTLIQAIGTISRTVGFRMGSHLNRVIPLFLKFMKTEDDESMQNEAGNELRENILHAMESFVLRCPREVSTHLPEILKVVLVFLPFDPNYNYDTDEEQDDEDMEEYSDYEDDGDYSDDDDTSWKVRRSSVKVLTSIVMARPEMLQELYSNAADVLLQRFKEREENVKIGVINCFTELIRATNINQTVVSRRRNSMGPPVLQRQRSSVGLLQSRIPNITKMCVRVLKEKKANKTKLKVYALLTQLVKVVGGGLEKDISELMPYTIAAMSDSDSALKLESLVFFKHVFESHSQEALCDHLVVSSKTVVNAIADERYKVSAEALRTIVILVGVLRPINDDMFESSSVDYSKFVPLFYNGVLSRLSARDIDQEIKESAIEATGSLLATFGDELKGELPTVLPLLLDRLRNDFTRITALRAFCRISKSPVKVDLSLVIADVIRELASFLRQQSRNLKQETFKTLTSLVSSYGHQISPELFNLIITNTANLITDADLHLSHHALVLCGSILETCPAVSENVQTCIIPKSVALAYSPLLQGLALESLLVFIAQVGDNSKSGVSFKELLELILLPISQNEKLSKNSVRSISLCVAALCGAQGNKGEMSSTILKFTKDIQGNEMTDEARQVAILSIGEIGSKYDLSSISPRIHEVLLELFDESAAKEEVKSAAANALGSIAIGNLKTFLPVIMNKVKEGSAHQYLLLSSMRQVLSRYSKDDKSGILLPVEEILTVLGGHCENKEEGVRNMVAECYGNLAIAYPNEVIPNLSKSISTTKHPLHRWTLITALKFTVAGETKQFEAVLKSNIGPFFETLKDEDLHVRRAGLSTLNSIVHHQPSLVHDILAKDLVPILYHEMTVKPELKRKVDLGPFKHLVDDGLPLRKSSFSCMATIIETCLDTVNIGDFMHYLCGGLSDVEDVQMLCHQILVQLCSWTPLQVMAHITVILEPLNRTLNKNIKDSLVGTEVERAYDVVRSALRALDAISTIPEAKQDKKVQDTLQFVQKKENLKRLLEVERQHSNNRW